MRLLAQIGDLNWRKSVRRRESEHPRIEVILPLQRLLNILRLAEAVLLAGEFEEGDGQAFALERVGHAAGLVGRDDAVFKPLEEDDRAGETVKVVDRRALPVQVGALRVGADEPIHVMRLEFVRVLRERFAVADAVVARAGGEEVAEGQAAQDGVSAALLPLIASRLPSASPRSTR